MRHILIILSLFLLHGCIKKQSPPEVVKSDEKCYVVVESSKDIDPSLLSNISISLISKFLRDVEQVSPSGISLDSCQYRISVSKKMTLLLSPSKEKVLILMVIQNYLVQMGSNNLFSNHFIGH